MAFTSFYVESGRNFQFRDTVKRFSVAVLAGYLGSVSPAILAGEDANHAQRLCNSAELVSQVELEGGIRQEISGLAASRTQRGIYWAHRDSGNEAELLAFSESGKLLQTYTLEGASNRDWEDIAIARSDNGMHKIYLADIGDNKRRWPHISLYEVDEPVVKDAGASATLSGVRQMRFRYPDKIRNAESFFIDERDSRFYIVSKETRKKYFWPYPDGESYIYSGSLDQLQEEIGVLQAELSVDFVALDSTGHARFRDEVGSRPVAEATTAADMHPVTNVIAVRTYGSLWLWQVGAGQSVAEALAADPCEAPTVNELGGEAMTFDLDGDGYITVSEYFPKLSSFSIR